MRDCSVDYVELGFRTLKTVGFMGPCAYTKDEFINEVENRMTKNNCLSVPLEIDIGYGNNWDEAH